MRWILVAIIVAATATADVLQAMGMHRHGEITDFRPGDLGRRFGLLASNWFIVTSVAAMAVSFFAFLALVSIAELSFAVPATAAAHALEMVMARFLLKEQVSWLRWAGAALVICGVVLLAA